MRRISIVATLAMSVAILNVDTAAAYEGTSVRFASHSSVQEMLDRIESLEATLASYDSNDEIVFGADGELIDGGGGKGGCESCGSAGGCNCVCGDGPAIYAGVEIVFAKPHFEDEIETDDGEADYSYEGSPRLYIGGRNDHGFGGRLRWWQWDHHSNDGSANEDPFRLGVDAIDLDATQMVCWGPVNAMFFGGVRYGRVLHQDNDNDGSTFEGTGPTVGIDVNVPIQCTNLSFIGNFRYAALFGHSRFTGNDRGDDDFVGNIETQLGLQYSHCCSRGTFNLRAVIEAQQWEDAADDPTDGLGGTSNTDEDLAFIGFGFGLEFVY